MNDSNELSPSLAQNRYLAAADLHINKLNGSTPNSLYWQDRHRSL